MSRRKPGNRSIKTFIHLCVEGQATEKEYFEALNSEPRMRNKVTFKIRKVEPDPLQLVEEAKALAMGSGMDETDQVWCVFDVEYPIRHGRLMEAVELARKAGINTAVSNPAFEVWLLFHTQKVTKHMSSEAAKKMQRGNPPSSQRDFYSPLLEVAVSNAREMEKLHMQNAKRFPDNNPSSSVFKLIEAVEKILVA